VQEDMELDDTSTLPMLFHFELVSVICCHEPRLKNGWKSIAKVVVMIATNLE
jgi:hypothetical protein